MSKLERGRVTPFRVGGGTYADPLFSVEEYMSGRVYVKFNNRPMMLQEGNYLGGVLRLYGRPVIHNEGSVALQEEVLGLNQTPQDVAASRSAGTAYQNTTGKPIMVNAHITGAFEISSDGVTWVHLAQSGNTSQTFMIPSGYFYRLAAGGAIFSWVETR